MTTRIRRTECMTFPRSGHGLLQKLLTRYFGSEDFVYCESYGDPERMLDHDSRTNFQKNHDLELTTPIREDRGYVVQIRYPVESIVSWYTLACELEGLEDSPGSWTNFAIQKTAFWMQFYRKWVLDHVPGRLVVNYADLIDEPAATLGRVVTSLSDSTPDPQRLDECCRAEDVARRHFVTGFKYYGPSFFSLFKAFFAAVPGVDIDRDELVVPTESGDALGTAVLEAIGELRRSGARLNDVAGRLSEVKAANLVLSE